MLLSQRMMKIWEQLKILVTEMNEKKCNRLFLHLKQSEQDKTFKLIITIIRVISQDHKCCLKTPISQDQNHQFYKKAQNLTTINKKLMGIIKNLKNRQKNLVSLNLQLEGKKRREMNYNHRFNLKNQFHLLKDYKQMSQH